MKFGNYLKQIREEKNWTQPIAAKHIGIEQSYLSKLETGKSYPGEDIFDRLVETFDIDIDEMTRLVEAADLQKLKEVKSVRIAIVNQHRHSVSISRKWMVAGVISLALAGASIGATFVPLETERQYYYRSDGVLKPNEALTTFDDIYFSNKQKNTDDVLARLDQSDILLNSYRGENFLELVPEGRRYYKFLTFTESNALSPMRYFLIPGLMFLFGGFGCFFNAFKWGR